MFSEIINECPRQHHSVNATLKDWFVGSYAMAIDVLRANNDTESLAIQFWTAEFFGRDREISFLTVYQDARQERDPDGRNVWVLPDLVALDFAQSLGGVILTECVEIAFASREMRRKFLAYTDYFDVMAAD